MSDIYALPPIPSGGIPSGSFAPSGMFSTSSLLGDMSGVSNGAYPSLPSESGTTTGNALSSVLGGLTGNATSNVTSTAQSSTSGTSGSATSGSTSLTTFSADSLIGRIAFFLLGIVFMAGAIYTYKR